MDCPVQVPPLVEKKITTYPLDSIYKPRGSAGGAYLWLPPPIFQPRFETRFENEAPGQCCVLEKAEGISQNRGKSSYIAIHLITKIIWGEVLIIISSDGVYIYLVV